MLARRRKRNDYSKERIRESASRRRKRKDYSKERIRERLGRRRKRKDVRERIREGAG